MYRFSDATTTLLTRTRQTEFSATPIKPNILSLHWTLSRPTQLVLLSRSFGISFSNFGHSDAGPQKPLRSYRIDSPTVQAAPVSSEFFSVCWITKQFAQPVVLPPYSVGLIISNHELPDTPSQHPLRSNRTDHPITQAASTSTRSFSFSKIPHYPPSKSIHVLKASTVYMKSSNILTVRCSNHTSQTKSRTSMSMPLPQAANHFHLLDFTTSMWQEQYVMKQLGPSITGAKYPIYYETRLIATIRVKAHVRYPGWQLQGWLWDWLKAYW